MSHLPPEAYDDCFRPPAIPTEVFCLHCHQVYESYRIEWRENAHRRGTNDLPGFWCCPTPGCDGKGFGFDIFPTDPEYVGEHGGPMWCDDDEDEFDEFEASDEFDEIGDAELALPDGDQLPLDDDDADTSIPLDDLLPEANAGGDIVLTPDLMREIERKLGMRDDATDPNPGHNNGSKREPPPDTISEDDIPY